jgi:RimJ/RimL family protein N-acetyltransferase
MTGRLLHVRGGIAFCGIWVETTAMAWLPADFIHPTRVPVCDGYHLRPITAADADLDYPAVMRSQPRLWSIFGPAWGWPPVSMTYQQDREDLARHEAEIMAHQSFNYALFDDAKTALLGCVYIDPPEKQGADAEICWWVVDDQAGTTLQSALDTLVPRWIAGAWPFTQPRYIGLDLSWPTGSPCRAADPPMPGRLPPPDPPSRPQPCNPFPVWAPAGVTLLAADDPT